MIDLRSDTVTKPPGPMREAMAAAEVGDDQYGEDPTVNVLQERVADLLGKEAALFMATGTMANQTMLKLLTRPGEEVILPEGCHMVWHEVGAAAMNAGVQFTVAGDGPLLTADDVAAAFKPRDHIIFPASALVVVENTHNRGGGVCQSSAEASAVCDRARELGLATACDGARLFNASVALGEPMGALAAPFDMVWVALSKGLGCPMGSVLAGPADLIRQAIRVRRALGGAWRQAGIMAAAGIWALDHSVGRLAEDHDNARTLAERIAGLSGLSIDLDHIETNIVIFELGPEAPDAPRFVTEAARRGVALVPFGPRLVRATTHLDVSAGECAKAADVIEAMAADWG